MGRGTGELWGADRGALGLPRTHPSSVHPQAGMQEDHGMLRDVLPIPILAHPSVSPWSGAAGSLCTVAALGLHTGAELSQ